MCGQWHRTLLITAFGLALLSPRAAAQDLPPRPTPPATPEPAVAAAPERRGSPVETLESLTGGRAGERPEPASGARMGGRAGERQEERDEIETDRDSFTPATVIAPRGRFILESAYSFVDNRGFKETHSFPETILRYGLTERVELRLGWNAEIGGSGSAVSGSDAGGEDDVARGHRVEREYTLTYGAKFRVTDQDRWVPRSIVIVQGFTPTGGSEGTSTATALIATYAAGWALPNRWQFDASIRYGLDSERGDRFSEWAPSAVLRVPLGEKWATHIEYFGLVTSGKERNITKHFISPGVRYLVTPDLEIGVRVGWGLNDQSARFFSNAGFGWRF